MVELPQSQVTIGTAKDIDSQAITSDAIQPEMEVGSELEPQPLGSAFAEETADQTNPQPSLPTDWQASGNNRYRQVALIGVVAIITIVSSVALFSLFVRSSMNDVADTNTPEPNTPIEQESDATTPIDDTLSTTETNEVAEEINDAAPSDSVVDPEPEPDTRVETEPTDPKPEADANPPSPEPPRELLPDQDIDRIFGAPEPETNADTVAMDALPEGLQRFSNMFDVGLAAEDGPKQPNAQTKNRRIQFDPPPPASERFAAPSTKIDIAKQLAHKLGFDIKTTPFARAISLIAESLAVPLTVDIESLDSAGVDTMRSTDARLLNLDAAEALRKMLAPVGCNLDDSVDGLITIRSDEQHIRTFVGDALKIDDLEPIESVATIVSRVASAPDDTVNLTYDQTTHMLIGDASAKGIWRAALACDAVRICRGVPQKLPTRHTARWLSDSPIEFAVPNTGKILLEGNLPRPTTSWLRQIASANGAAVMIDWPSAWQHGLTPTKMILPWSTHDSLESAEQELLSEYGLVIRDLGFDTWIVTTPRALEFSIQTIAFPKPVEDGDTLLAQVAQAAGYEDLGTFPGAVDPVSNRIVCRLPRFMITQIHTLIETQ